MSDQAAHRLHPARATRPRCWSRSTRASAAAEGLDIELVREVSWSNIRDKLNIGLFDAAHLIAPIAIASSLGLGHIKVPIIAPFGLGVNGNAITVSPALHAAIARGGRGRHSSIRWCRRSALARVVAARKARGEEPLTFGMTFPFSTHNYHLRFWMAAGGVDPDEDVRLVVLPPPYMVESLQNGHVDGFCVGAPWNSVAVDLGIGHILHFVSEILARAAEKAARPCASAGPRRTPTCCARLVRAHRRAADFVEDANNRDEVAALLAAPQSHRGRGRGDPPHARRPAEGLARRRVTAPTSAISWSAARAPRAPIRRRPHGSTRRWCAGDRRRCRREMLAAAKAVWRPDLYDAALGATASPLPSEPADGIGAFAGPAFDPDDIAAHLAAWNIKRAM